MIEDDEIGQSEHIMSSDSAWVECRSRTHFGRVYYFNKVTGEAAWNLTESEIEKARRETHKYGKQFQQLDSCPEPKDPPMDHSKNHNVPIARVYNKQIINQFRQPHPFEPVVGAYHQLMPSMPIGPMGLQQYGIPNQFNSNVWTIPPMHQIFITPPLVNQMIQPPSYPQSNLPLENDLLQNRCPSEISARLDHTERQSRRSPLPPRANQGYQQNNNSILNLSRKAMKRKMRKENNTPRFKAGQKDLRQILAEKRKQRELAEYHQMIPNKKPKTEDPGIVNHTTKSRSEIDSNDDCPQTDDVDCGGDWLEENMSVCGTKLKLNLTNLKNLSKPDANTTDIWYIVADTDVYLKHLNFLNILLNSDEQCHLMMPREVYSLLQAVVDSSGAENRRRVNRARRAIALFKQLLDAKVAVVGDSPDECENDVISCCQNLADHNYHVILLSNNTTLHELKSETTIPIFTIKEIKKIISDSSNDQENPVMPVDGPLMITIDNDFRPNTEINTAHKVDFGVQIDSQDCAQEGPNIMSLKTEICKGKNILDVGVQTDLASWETSDLGTSLPSSQEHCDGNKAVQTDYIFHSQSNANNDNLVDSDQNGIQCDVHKREIRLKRNTTRPASETNIDVEKRQFKWRARKVTIKQPIIASTSSNSMPNDANRGTGSPVKLSESNTAFKIADNVESSQASSLSHQTTPSWNIEETSTSGVISNSSEVEFQIQRQNQTQQLNTDHQGSKLTENVMFEVSDDNMAQYLKIKRDEWVSRFVQIMEEVLTQVLQKDPPFRDVNMPPPWTIQEAAEGITFKFHDHGDIVKTAHDFIDILDQISDKGRIKVDLSPHQFMDTYSFGVHLVKILQTVMCDFEDIATALDLLSRLLTDIRNPHTDSSYHDHDAFGDSQEAKMETSHVSHVTSNDTLTRSMDIAIDNIINSHLDINDVQIPDFETFGDNFHAVATCTSNPDNSELGKTQMSCENSIVAQIDSILSEQPNQAMITNAKITSKNDDKFKTPSLNLAQNTTSNSGGSSKLDFTSNSPHIPIYHNFDSDSLLQSPQSHSVLQSKLDNSPKIARNVTINSDFKIENETLKIIKNKIVGTIISETKIEDETPKIPRNVITNPVIDALKPRQIDMSNPSPLSTNVMDEILDYEGDCCPGESPDTRNEPLEGNMENEPTVSDENEKADRYCKLVEELSKIVSTVISFCEGVELDMTNERRLTQIKTKKIGLKLLDVWKATERILRRKSGDQALPSIPNSNREVLLNCCDQAVVVIKWLNQINTHINNISIRCSF